MTFKNLLKISLNFCFLQEPPKISLPYLYSLHCASNFNLLDILQIILIFDPVTFLKFSSNNCIFLINKFSSSNCIKEWNIQWNINPFSQSGKFVQYLLIYLYLFVMGIYRYVDIDMCCSNTTSLPSFCHNGFMATDAVGHTHVPSPLVPIRSLHLMTRRACCIRLWGYIYW